MMDVSDYMAALKNGKCEVTFINKKGELRRIAGTLPHDARQRIEGSDIVPIVDADGVWKSFDVSRVQSFSSVEV